MPGKVPLVSVLSPTPLSHPGWVNGLCLSLSSDSSLGETCSIRLSQTEREYVLEAEVGCGLPGDRQVCRAKGDKLEGQRRHYTQSTWNLE